jgi:hypothetical protein
MKHKVHGKQNLNNSYILLDVELFPDSDKEKEAITKVGAMKASEEQKDLVENYLLFGLNVPYSVVSVEKQNNTRFILKASLQ